MSKRVEVLDGRLVLQMRHRSLRSRVAVTQWAEKLKAHLQPLTEMVGDEKTAQGVLFNLAVLLAYTEGVAAPTNEPALIGFVAWWAGQGEPSFDWVLEHCDTPDVVLEAWGAAYEDGIQVLEIAPERKPYDQLTPEEAVDATDPKATSSSAAGNGSRTKSKQPNDALEASTSL